VITSIDGRKSMLKLAERMVASFCGGVTASAAHQWTTLSGSGAEDVRVMTRKSVDDPGRPPGIVLNAATSFWMPVPPKRVFEFLRDESSRSEVPCRTYKPYTCICLLGEGHFPDKTRICSGTSSPTAARFKKWLTSPMAGTMGTVSPFFVSM
jgi:hypothetical protein